MEAQVGIANLYAVRKDAPIRRGLKRTLLNSSSAVRLGPKGRPDQKGIETDPQILRTPAVSVRKDAPIRRGLKHMARIKGSTFI